MKKYVKIQHPTRGTLPLLTYEFQDEALNTFQKNTLTAVLKSRQMGISTLVAAYSLWLMTFHTDKEILCLSITQETSKAIVTKVRFANDNLPSWLKVKEETNNQLSLRLTNGSQIRAVSSASNSGRSAAVSLLIIDEAAFIDGVEAIWLSAQSTLSTGGKAIILSTPNGVGNFFHKTWMESPGNKFVRVNLPWYLHPDRDQAWRDNQTKLLGERGAAQECDCEFSTSGNTVVEIGILDWYTENYVIPPIEMRGADHGYWIWKYPEDGKSYMIVGDVGRGDASDFSGAQVIDIESMEQVAEYKGKLPTKDYARSLMAIGTEYNMGLVVVENANIGWAVIQEIIDKLYPNLFYSSADLQYVDTESQMTNKINSEEKKLKPGFTTSSKTRPLVISKLESYIRNKEFIIRSSRLIDELKVFIWKSVGVSSRAEAMSGYNDDLVMAAGIAMWIRDVALRLRTERDNVTKILLGKIGSNSAAEAQRVQTRTAIIQSNPYGVANDPWTMKMGTSDRNREDLRWLL